MVERILAINPGATSTKIGYFENDELVFKDELNYTVEELAKEGSIQEQYDLRFKDIVDILKKNKLAEESLDTVVGRGGLLPPVDAGAYIVNDEILDFLKNNPVLEHASNLGASLAKGIAEIFGVTNCPSYIYDPITVDQLDDVARISGLESVERKSVAHVLNMRAVCMKIAEEELDKTYEESKLIVAHIGGGSSASVHRDGRMVDIVMDDEGFFSPERVGGLPLKDIIPLCYEYSQEEIMNLTRKNGGLISYFGTNDTREVEAMAHAGNEKAKIVLKALAYQIAKGIGQLSVVLSGEVDGIILTGGLANSRYITGMIQKRVEFIAPVYLVPGEAELLALAKGARRVLREEEDANVFYSP